MEVHIRGGINGCVRCCVSSTFFLRWLLNGLFSRLFLGCHYILLCRFCTGVTSFACSVSAVPSSAFQPLRFDQSMPAMAAVSSSVSVRRPLYGVSHVVRSYYILLCRVCIGQFALARNRRFCLPVSLLPCTEPCLSIFLAFRFVGPFFFRRPPMTL